MLNLYADGCMRQIEIAIAPLARKRLLVGLNNVSIYLVGFVCQKMVAGADDCRMLLV